ncbi:MAG: hypothetical protein H7835_19465 [Magnetococcus sp. XQGC-1]
MENLDERMEAYRVGRAMIEQSRQANATKLDRNQGEAALAILHYAAMKAKPNLERPAIIEVARAGRSGRPIPEPAVIPGDQSVWGEILTTFQSLADERATHGEA